MALGVNAIKNNFSATHSVLDDLRFRPVNCHEANLLFRLLSALCEKGSIALASNKHVRDWAEIFAGDEVLTTAILDRLLRQ